MKEMKTLTMGGSTYEIVDEWARNELSRTKANAITTNVEGPVIRVNDSSINALSGLRIYGKSSQAITTGAQLFDKSTVTQGMLEKDDTITTDGAYVTSDYIPVSPSIDYYHTDKNSIRTKFYDANKTPLTDDWDIPNSAAGTFTTPADAYYVRTTIGAQLVDAFMLHVGTTKKPYEPYSGGVPSPCLAFPQEVMNIDNPTIKVHKKNMIPYPYDESNLTRAGITYTAFDDGSVIANGTSTGSYIYLINENSKRIYLVAGVNYFLRACPTGGSLNTYYAYIKIGDQTLFDIGSGVSITPNVSGWASVIFTVKSGVSVASLPVTPQLEVGNTASEYEPYVCQTNAIPRTLSGIPVTSGGNYTDENGQQWICDEIDFERGVYIQRIASGTFTLAKEAYEYGDLTYRYTYYTGSGVLGANECLCDELPYNPAAGTSITTHDGIRINKDSYYIVAQYTGDDGASETIDLNVTYVLNTPVETQLSKDELKVYRQLHTNYLNTTFVNDFGAWMETTYAVDLKTYIHNLVGLIGGV